MNNPAETQEIYPDLPVLVRTTVVLASGSPRRRELLSRLLPANGFEVIAADIDESVYPNEPPTDYVLRVAKEKATRGAELAVKLSQPDRSMLIISADTSVVLNDKIYGKPGISANAVSMLQELSGKTHQVITGVSIYLQHPDGSSISDSLICSTNVEMRDLSYDEILWYVNTGEPLDKAGGYAVQGFGGIMIGAIQGDYYNVVGLPLGPLVEMLRKIKI